MNIKFKDRTGQRHGRLVALERCGQHKNGRFIWLCQCDCGNKIFIDGGRLSGIGTRSCGCILLENNKSRPVRNSTNVKHGETKTKHSSRTSEYTAWFCMRQRCTNKNKKNWIDYGGRGIKYCESWEKYENFIRDMGRKPSKKHSLDRIDVNGDYSPENCRWADVIQQANNRRNTQHAIISGLSMTCTEISNLLNIPARTIGNWITELGNGCDISDKISKYKKSSRPRIN